MMKLTFALFCAMVIGLVCAEHCRMTEDCKRHHTTLCHMLSSIVCNSGFCECSMGTTGVTCSLKSECASVDCTQHGNKHEAHCVDGHCQCTLRPGGN